ncbi:aldo/keto reductase [Streptomyces sp. NP160]|uniref:aldo/keto reductase n=1 Tax=Streptomyces sp. NP160 TaxID=2586637 RepID=UPI00111AD400|nr:aldo/keto reductase [Streptomyces sp. NP160]TNM69638.1 aldo/keto reductase [Streptomyces sp. NP160]
MRYRTLGGTGIKVSTYALGAMVLGSYGNPDRSEGIRIIHRALDAGINTIDTADFYGDSEEVVGLALQGRRDDVVLATKAGLPFPGDPNRGGGSRRWIVHQVEASLRALRTDHIDLFQLHRPDPDTDVEETLSALTDLVASGKVRAIGTSSMPASDIVEAQWAAQRRGLQRFRSEQPTYSMLTRSAEAEVLPVAQRHGMGVVVWSPLAMGMLTGRVRRGQPTDLTRSERFTHLADAARIDAVERLVPVADQAGLSLTHLAMAFVVAHPAVTAALIGPRTMEHLEDLLAGAEVVLGDDVLDAVDAVVPPGTDVGRVDVAHTPPALERPTLRRRVLAERAAA